MVKATALAVEPLFISLWQGFNANPGGLSDLVHAYTKLHYVLLCKNGEKHDKASFVEGPVGENTDMNEVTFANLLAKWPTLSCFS